MIIAIDGPAAAGKGTLAKRLAAHFHLAYLETGLLYRAVGLRILRARQNPADAKAAAEAASSIAADDLHAPELRGEAAAGAASIVATHPEVRDALLNFQRNFARNPPGDVKGAALDGRDIGTVICPERDVIKLYVFASLAKRAERRVRELQARGESPIYARVLQDMRERDLRDASRGVAALKIAPDAFKIDTSDLTADQAFAKALDFIKSRTRPAG
ncbi:MAG: (d)CMP kinase [Rhodospirillales bacterium]|nr:(d)CMP kinase [Rhodospirillales bacterium]